MPPHANMPDPAAFAEPALLRVENLSIGFAGTAANVVDSVSFSIAAGKTLCLVGESGCGKSVTSLAIMGLLPPKSTRIPSGRAEFDGRDLLHLPRAELETIRGDRLAMIFQEPMTSLNPSFTVGDQIAEAVRRHRKVSHEAARERALEMFRRVRIPSPEQRLREYPYQLSGGMRQRVMIAMALANDPQLLIADEPTTALDVTIQAQILELMRELQRETGTSMLLITHDLGVVAETADMVAVMYAGHIVESGPVEAIFRDPQHPYTIGLMGSMPSLGARTGRLATIRGSVPPPQAMPAGCRFSTRCPFADDRCRREVPPFVLGADGHGAACFKAPLEIHIEGKAG
ncbi:ABC transporter ATP-binding protein [Mesorhizobium sp. BR1-1-16]|uniref:ABC transporter ATP-binding protein n=1 Tax=Mesorhizobium sp. BR1-1-16 TaxID=2876653 RepID=UPI001CCC3F3A|nr:ABC transporter ATP-binding protein [Mesorhizobium sp. BR1-1-16]MBZ9939352.1 ABC transporter ATP-binding protein [Mesorhizobium sp. BR1-1-16]